MTLKIDIFLFQLKKITQQVQRKRGEKIYIGYKTEDEFVSIDEIYRALQEKSQHENITAFADVLINNFDSSFKQNSDNTLAISIPEHQGYLNFSASRNTLNGRFIGGRTGIERKVYNTSDAINSTGSVEKNSVTTLPFFFKIWLPQDVNYGVVMVQGYSNMCYSSLLLKQVEQCFISVGYKMFYKKYILKSFRKKFLENSVLNRIQIQHAKVDGDVSFTSKLAPLKEAKRTMTFKNFCIRFADFIAPESYLVDFKSAISELDKNYDSEKDSVTLHYSLEDGSKASANLSNLDAVFPPLYLPDDFIDGDSNLPIWSKLEEYSDTILDEIKEEYKYTPKAL